MKDFSGLNKNLKKDFTGLKKIKVALLGDTATQFLNKALRGYGYDQQLNLEIWEADFNQIERQVFDATSELYAYEPDWIIIFQSSHQLNTKYSKLKPGEYCQLASTQISLIGDLCKDIDASLKTKIIYYNYAEIDDAVFGNFANQTEQSFLFQLRKLNYEMMLYAGQQANFFVCDLSSIQNLIGKQALFSTTIYVNTEMVLSIDALPLVAQKTVGLMSAMEGNIKKCLILDLDNTLWGGVIGDDGLDHIQLGALGIGKAFTELQYWIKKLKNRGIIIAVCSKNTESVAMEPFDKHPDMVLKADDIAIFVANWDNKVDNIRQIQKVLNIGFDSMVFLDDNPFERNIVRTHLPALTVPELPADPADVLEYLYTLNLFEAVSFADQDKERTEQYQVATKRAAVAGTFTDVNDFLKSLGMVSLVAPFNTFNGPRVAQLSQRSNQFNVRTLRYSEADIQKLINRNDTFTFSFTLEDTFGDNGLISLVVLKKETDDTLFIENWLMSCRVLKRGMESFVLNTLVDFAKNNNYRQLKGEYIPTAKNEMVKDHYQNLGFTKADAFWVLDCGRYENSTCHIKKKQND